MNKSLLILGILLAVGAVVFIGVRDIDRYKTQEAGGVVSSAPGSVAAPAAKIDKIMFVKNPQPMPEFSLKDLDGNTLTPKNWRGKVVLVNFWATWCGPCREEIPDLVNLQNRYGDKLQIVGLSDDSSPVDEIKKFVKDHGMNYPVAIAPHELEARFGGIVGLPTSFIVDTEGRIVQKHIGLRNPVLYDTEIRALLDLPIEAQIETFEDKGQVLLSNAKNATELPGVDFSHLTADQRRAALRQLNEESCPCGCNMTLAQCRVNDTSCNVSAQRAVQIVAQFAGQNIK